MNRRKFLQQTSSAVAAVTFVPAAAANLTGKGGAFRVGFLTDTHVKPTAVAEAGMRSAFRHANTLKPKLDFIINGGDSIMDVLKASREKVQLQWDVWNKVLGEENKLPIYHCIGNHDAWGWQMTDPEVKSDPLYDKRWVMQQHGMKERFHSFEKGKWKFIILDSAQENNGGYIARIDEPQFSWLENELKSTSTESYICIVSHIPIVSFCSAMFADKNEPNGDWKISRALLHTDSQRLTELFHQYPNIVSCLSGHIHLQDMVEYRGIQYYCNGAVSGDWWGGPFKGFAPAYAVFDFSDAGTVKRTMINYL